MKSSMNLSKSNRARLPASILTGGIRRFFACLQGVDDLVPERRKTFTKVLRFFREFLRKFDKPVAVISHCENDDHMEMLRKESGFDDSPEGRAFFYVNSATVLKKLFPRQPDPDLHTAHEELVSLA